MLRLWPKTVAVYLFPGISWLKGKGRVTTPLLCPAVLQPAAFLEQLKLILDAQDPPLEAGTKIALTVSDTLASIVTMPWQPSLKNSAEIDAYAHACFQQAGVTLGDEWTMQAQFRNFESIGLAFAFQTNWLRDVLNELKLRQLVLASLLPLSASIYFGVNARARPWPALVLAREHFRYVAYVFGPAGMLGYDVETIIGSAEQSAQRLDGRITSQYGVHGHQRAWIAYAKEEAVVNTMLLGFQAWEITA